MNITDTRNISDCIAWMTALVSILLAIFAPEVEINLANNTFTFQKVVHFRDQRSFAVIFLLFVNIKHLVISKQRSTGLSNDTNHTCVDR